MFRFLSIGPILLLFSISNATKPEIGSSSSSAMQEYRELRVVIRWKGEIGLFKTWHDDQPVDRPLPSERFELGLRLANHPNLPKNNPIVVQRTGKYDVAIMKVPLYARDLAGNFIQDAQFFILDIRMLWNNSTNEHRLPALLFGANQMLICPFHQNANNQNINQLQQPCQAEAFDESKFNRPDRNVTFHVRNFQNHLGATRNIKCKNQFYAQRAAREYVHTELKFKNKVCFDDKYLVEYFDPTPNGAINHERFVFTCDEAIYWGEMENVYEITEIAAPRAGGKRQAQCRLNRVEINPESEDSSHYPPRPPPPPTDSALMKKSEAKSEAGPSTFIGPSASVETMGSSNYRSPPPQGATEVEQVQPERGPSTILRLKATDSSENGSPSENQQRQPETPGVEQIPAEFASARSSPDLEFGLGVRTEQGGSARAIDAPAMISPHTMTHQVQGGHDEAGPSQPPEIDRKGKAKQVDEPAGDEHLHGPNIGLHFGHGQTSRMLQGQQQLTTIEEEQQELWRNVSTRIQQGQQRGAAQGGPGFQAVHQQQRGAAQEGQGYQVVQQQQRGAAQGGQGYQVVQQQQRGAAQGGQGYQVVQQQQRGAAQGGQEGQSSQAVQEVIRNYREPYIGGILGQQPQAVQQQQQTQHAQRSGTALVVHPQAGMHGQHQHHPALLNLQRVFTQALAQQALAQRAAGNVPQLTIQQGAHGELQVGPRAVAHPSRIVPSQSWRPGEATGTSNTALEHVREQQRRQQAEHVRWRQQLHHELDQLGPEERRQFLEQQQEQIRQGQQNFLLQQQRAADAANPILRRFSSFPASRAVPVQPAAQPQAVNQQAEATGRRQYNRQHGQTFPPHTNLAGLDLELNLAQNHPILAHPAGQVPQQAAGPTNAGAEGQRGERRRRQREEEEQAERVRLEQQQRHGGGEQGGQEDEREAKRRRGG